MNDFDGIMGVIVERYRIMGFQTEMRREMRTGNIKIALSIGKIWAGMTLTEEKQIELLQNEPFTTIEWLEDMMRTLEHEVTRHYMKNMKMRYGKI